MQYILWGPYDWTGPPRPGGTGLPCHGTDTYDQVHRYSELIVVQNVKSAY